MTQRYLVITSGEDGIDLEAIDHAELMERVNPKEDGHTYYGGDEQIVFLDKIPNTEDGHFIDVPERAVLIVKFEIVVPKPVATVLKYEV